MAVAHGGLMGWFSPANRHFQGAGLYFEFRLNKYQCCNCINQSTDSPIGPTSDDSRSWLASISYIGGFIGTFFFMEVIKVLGRKNTILILAIPNFV